MSRLLVAAMSLSLLAGMAAYAGPPGRCGDTYQVVRGDTLYRIARRCRSSVVAIAEASRLADPRRIEIGDRLVIPGRAAPVPAPGKPDEASGDRLVYAFQPTDTLYSLARWSRVSLRALMATNPGIDPANIEIGDPIHLPQGAVDPGALRQRERGPVRAAAPPPPPRPAPPPRLRREQMREAPRPAPDDDKPGDRADDTDPARGPTGMW
jgi:lipoprotein NlpD